MLFYCQKPKAVFAVDLGRRIYFGIDLELEFDGLIIVMLFIFNIWTNTVCSSVSKY